MSHFIEEIILKEREKFYENDQANGDELYEKVKTEKFYAKPASWPLQLPSFNLPYYEGLNHYNDKYWLGIYRRDELFSISFLKEVCMLCLKYRCHSIMLYSMENDYHKRHHVLTIGSIGMSYSINI